MKILSKKQSSEIIKKLGLNRVPEIILSQYDKDAICNFCNTHPSTKYILRDLDNPNGKYFSCKDKDECINNATNYIGNFSLAISCFSYNKIVLLGEILINKSQISLIARDDENANHRNIHENPKYNIITNIEDNKLWKIDGFEDIANCIIKHRLYDIIVEFVVYDKCVGTNNEKALIVELRSEY